MKLNTSLLYTLKAEPSSTVNEIFDISFVATEAPDIVKEEFDFSSATVKEEPDDVDVQEEPLEIRKKCTALKLAARSERRWQVIAPDALPPTRVNLERSTEDVPETSMTDIQLETENHVSPPAGCEFTTSTNADLTTIDPVGSSYTAKWM
ncbi:hypothetical protein Anas_06402 [Armadillidium nasatum]|uniref:Uncharacterized protein n=1 Tax=Armadillidium nasatum TaxID=96803 RepID=A0A5N5TNH0_9CRUS|nr:hypothetical protein Anas_06402 [Armadillidium nasatum]